MPRAYRTLQSNQNRDRTPHKPNAIALPSNPKKRSQHQKIHIIKRDHNPIKFKTSDRTPKNPIAIPANT
ncbi:MAG: hypothetical protein HC903_07075 [Methylacidiphilales bacterium]|nr:hypothetical protein [Candidatus Methylacidiphilales bacterium]